MDDLVEQVPNVEQSNRWSIGKRWAVAHVISVASVLLAAFWLYNSTFYGIGVLLALPLFVVAVWVAQAKGTRDLLEEGREKRLWLLMSILSLSLIILIVSLCASARIPISAVGAVVLGCIPGLAQGAVLLRRYTRGLWWVPANGVGIGGAVLIAQGLIGTIGSVCEGPPDFFALMAIRDCRFPVMVLPPLAGIIFFAIVTGITLVWIAQREGSTPVALSRKYVGGTAATILVAFVLYLVFSALPI